MKLEIVFELQELQNISTEDRSEKNVLDNLFDSIMILEVHRGSLVELSQNFATETSFFNFLLEFLSTVNNLKVCIK